MMASTRLLYVPCAQLVGRSSSPSSSRWSSDDDDVRYQRRRCPPPATTMSATRHHAAGSHVGACPWRGALANDRQRPWATRFVLPWPRRMRALNSMPLSEDGQDARTSLLDVAGRCQRARDRWRRSRRSQCPRWRTSAMSEGARAPCASTARARWGAASPAAWEPNDSCPANELVIRGELERRSDRHEHRLEPVGLPPHGSRMTPAPRVSSSFAAHSSVGVTTPPR